MWHSLLRCIHRRRASRRRSVLYGLEGGVSRNDENSCTYSSLYLAHFTPSAYLHHQNSSCSSLSLTSCFVHCPLLAQYSILSTSLTNNCEPSKAHQSYFCHCRTAVIGAAAPIPSRETYIDTLTTIRASACVKLQGYTTTNTILHSYEYDR